MRHKELMAEGPGYPSPGIRYIPALNCSWDLASDLSFPEQSLVQNAAFQQGLSCTRGPGCLEPLFHVGRAEQLIQSLTTISLKLAFSHVTAEISHTAHAEVIRQQLSKSSYTGNYWPFNLKADGGDSTEKDTG